VHGACDGAIEASATSTERQRADEYAVADVQRAREQIESVHTQAE
jgi:hypothetical protein